MDQIQKLETWILSSKIKNIFLFLKNKPTEDESHDISHLLRVAIWTIQLAPNDCKEEATAAALLHDLVNLPKNHPQRHLASEYSARDALPLLIESGFPEEACSRICESIQSHSFSAGKIPTSSLGKALQDADRLEALGAIGLMRVFATGSKIGATFFHSLDPWAKNRELNDKKYSIDHFYTKLLSLPNTFQTIEGKREAQKRVVFMQDFLSQLSTEIGVPIS